ncbi:MAG: DUF5666 domain-containing protein [Armatimonadota bacterium]
MKRALFLGCAAALVLGCVWAVAQAPGPGLVGPGIRGGGAGGFVTSVGSDSIQVRMWGTNETLTIAVTSDTRIVKAQTLKPADLKAGDEVRVMGRVTGDQENAPIEAMTVMVGAVTTRRGGAPGGPGGRGFGGFGMAVGKIKTASANEIVVTTDSGDRTVKLTENTRIERTSEVALSDIKAGDWVTAAGPRQDSTVSARMIRVGEPPSNMPVFGLIARKDGGSIEVQPRFTNQKTKVTVPASAVVLRAEKAEVTDIKVGDRVTVIARPSGNQADSQELVASAILFGEPLPQGILAGGGFGGMTSFRGAPGTRGGAAGPGGAPGAPPGGIARSRTFTAEVTSVSPLTVRDGNTTRTLRVTGQTVIRKLTKATLDSANTNDAAAVFGKPTPDGAVRASLVVLGLTQSDLGRLGTGAGSPGGPPAPPGPPGT